MLDVAVIGGGLCGLAAACLEAERGRSVAVFEQEPSLGGALAPMEVEGARIEGFYHHAFSHNSELEGWLGRLGLGLEWHRASTAFMVSGALHGLTTPLDLLRYGPLAPVDRLRLARFLLGVRWGPAPDGQATAREWVEEAGGGRLYERVFRPLIEAKFGPDADEVSAEWLGGRLRLRTDRDLRGERLATVPGGGFGLLVEALAGRARRLGARVEAGSRVEAVELRGGRVTGVSVGGRRVAARAAVSTVPPRALLELADLPERLAHRLGELRFQGAVCVLAGLRRRASPYYWVNVEDERAPFGALIEHTNMVSPAPYGGPVAYLASYPPPRDAAWEEGEAEVAKRYVEGLLRLFPHLSPSDVRWTRVVRRREVGLVYRTGLGQLVPGIEGAVEGLFLGGLLNAYPERTMDAALRLGRSCADAAERYLSRG